MLKTAFKKIQYANILYIIFGVLIIGIGALFNPINHYIGGAIVCVAAILLYFYIVYFVAERNWLDIRAVFSGVWIFTIGLASLRLLDYQEPWENKTWVLLIVAYFVFQMGATIGVWNGNKCYFILKNIIFKLKPKKASLVFADNRLFGICITTTLIGFVCFAINVAIRGYIPAFSNNTSAYVDFYTKFHVFAVAATAISGLCYYCIKTQAISKVKKVILWLCIFYLVILFPVLVVSRGIFIVAALSLTTTIFYLNKRKLLVFVICLLVIGGVYLLTSNLRGYTDAQLDHFFEPSEIVLGDEDSDEDGEGDRNIFSLPPKVAFLYTYFTVSHDNFNEAVQNTTGYTWGARQFYPFNVILRIQGITDAIAGGEFYQVRDHLNTVNMVGLFYYDFHEWGVLICTFLWAIVFGLIQSFYMKTQGPLSLQVLGYAMNPVALSFFSSWIDSFELWMFWGVIFIVALVTWISFKTKVRNKE